MTMEAYYEQYHLIDFFPKEILSSSRLQHFQKGETIIAMGQPLDSLYCLVEGRTKTVFTTETGRQLLLSFQDPFKLFGDLEMFDENPEATNAIEAVSDCRLIVIPMTVVMRDLADNPKFLRQLAMSLGKKLGRVIKNSALNTLNPVEVRLASYIVAILDGGSGMTFSLNLSATADQLGTSFRHMHRTMESFKAAGLIEKKGKDYCVVDIEGLLALASNAYVFS